MTKGFWANLPRPFFALAPMADVTDAAFRRLVAAKGKPDVMWTEFVSCDGLCSPGKKKLLLDLEYTEAERPIVAQIFGATPEHFVECGKLIRELGFDGLDINMGCPDRSVEKQGAGAALMKDVELAKRIIDAAQRGAKDIPVSVKTRIGYATNMLVTWLPPIIRTGVAAITVHARTRNEMSKVPARWETIRETVEIVRASAPEGARPLVIGNGDVMSLDDGRKRAEESGADGVMIGRGIFGNPWLFADLARAKRDGQIERPAEGGGRPVTLVEHLAAMIEHTRTFEELFGENPLTSPVRPDSPQARIKNFAIMKKHYVAYVNGFWGAKELRMRLMQATNAQDVEKIVITQYPKVGARLNERS